MYDRETIEATKQAVVKWNNICYCGGEDKGCSLCNLYAYTIRDGNGEEDCFGCPIYDFTGHDCMELLDYNAWKIYYFNSNPAYRNKFVRSYPLVFDSKSRDLAFRELKFIKHILIKTLLLWDIKADWEGGMSNVNTH